MKNILLITSTIFLQAWTFWAIAGGKQNLWHILVIPLAFAVLFTGYVFFTEYKKHVAIILVLLYEFAFYDLFYSWLKGVFLEYTSYGDYWDKFFSQFPLHLIIFTKIITLIVAISVTFRYKLR